MNVPQGSQGRPSKVDFWRSQIWDGQPLRYPEGLDHGAALSEALGPRDTLPTQSLSRQPY